MLSQYTLNRYKNKYTLQTHSILHTEEAIECDVCDKKFTHISQLNNHMMSHTGEKPFGCSFCDKKFSRKNNKDRHERIHTGEKPFECIYCNKKFSDRTGLRDHKQRKHTDTRNYQCTFQNCKKRFKTKSDLNAHLKCKFHNS